MSECSCCKSPITGRVYKFEQCRCHIFCLTCFMDPAKIESLECNGCLSVLNNQSFYKENQVEIKCFYCNDEAIYHKCENSHNICVGCIASRKTDVNCYECYKIFSAFCPACKKIPVHMIPHPAHPHHSMCANCFNSGKFNAECGKCKKDINQVSDNPCQLCKKGSNVKQICESHFLCSQCIIIFKVYGTDAYKKAFNCTECFEIIKKKELGSRCSICLSDQSNLTPIPSCSKSHFCCENCSRGQFDLEYLACNECEEYFKHKNKTENKGCIICSNSSERLIKTCELHLICNNCLNSSECISTFERSNFNECQDCLEFIKNANEQDSKAINQQILKNGQCQICKKRPAFITDCPLHEYCKKCFNFKASHIQKEVNPICRCKYMIDNYCRKCLKVVSDKHCKTNCEFNHIYCFNCFTQEDTFLDEEICGSCRNFVLNEKGKGKHCMQCHNILNTQQICKNHPICQSCLKNPSNPSRENIQNCKKCIENLSSNCFNCHSQTFFKYLICFTECPEQHLYCKQCFGKIKDESQDSNCATCQSLFHKKGIKKIKKHCDYCSSLKIFPSNCIEHNLCYKCLFINSSRLIKDCQMCIEVFENTCMNCYCELTPNSLKLNFPTCDLMHFFCENCFMKLKNDKSVLCKACALKEKALNSFCDLCFRRESKEKLCRFHRICEICQINLKSKKGEFLIELLNCEECEREIEKYAKKDSNKSKEEEKTLIEQKTGNLNQIFNPKNLESGNSEIISNEGSKELVESKREEKTSIEQKTCDKNQIVNPKSPKNSHDSSHIDTPGFDANFSNFQEKPNIQNANNKVNQNIDKEHELSNPPKNLPNSSEKDSQNKPAKDKEIIDTILGQYNFLNQPNKPSKVFDKIPSQPTPSGGPRGYPIKKETLYSGLNNSATKPDNRPEILLDTPNNNPFKTDQIFNNSNPSSEYSNSSAVPFNAPYCTQAYTDEIHNNFNFYNQFSNTSSQQFYSPYYNPPQTEQTFNNYGPYIDYNNTSAPYLNSPSNCFNNSLGFQQSFPFDSTNQSYFQEPNLIDESFYIQQVIQVPKKKEGFCKNCKTTCARLKCKHADCATCFRRQFDTKFKLFVKALDGKDKSRLKSQNFCICCPVIHCNNKFCFPFMLFLKDASSIVAPYFDSEEMIEKFLLHYEGFFEGVEYSFDHCKYCRVFVGRAIRQSCLWCNF